MFKGELDTERTITWTAGIMYENATNDWHFPQTRVWSGRVSSLLIEPGVAERISAGPPSYWERKSFWVGNHWRP
jgi:hypothetical protein